MLPELANAGEELPKTLLPVVNGELAENLIVSVPGVEVGVTPNIKLPELPGAEDGAAEGEGFNVLPPKILLPASATAGDAFPNTKGMLLFSEDLAAKALPVLESAEALSTFPDVEFFPSVSFEI